MTGEDRGSGKRTEATMTGEADLAVRPEILPVGVEGLLVRFGTDLTEPANRAALALRAAIEAAALPGVEETATSLTAAYLRFDLRRTSVAALRAALEEIVGGRDWTAAPLPQGRRLWHVPTVFGTDLAPQLDEAAALAGRSAAQAIEDICAAPLRVQTIGFAPGQPYIGQLPAQWDLPRQSSLTRSVPEGALALAIRQMVLFSVSTPTGWRHVGQTALRLFRPEQPNPFLLRPGDELRFHPVTADALDRMRRETADGGAWSEVLG